MNIIYLVIVTLLLLPYYRRYYYSLTRPLDAHVRVSNLGVAAEWLQGQCFEDG